MHISRLHQLQVHAVMNMVLGTFSDNPYPQGIWWYYTSPEHAIRYCKPYICWYSNS